MNRCPPGVGTALLAGVAGAALTMLVLTQEPRPCTAKAAYSSTASAMAADHRYMSSRTGWVWYGWTVWSGDGHSWFVYAALGQLQSAPSGAGIGVKNERTPGAGVTSMQD